MELQELSTDKIAPVSGETDAFAKDAGVGTLTPVERDAAYQRRERELLRLLSQNDWSHEFLKFVAVHAAKNLADTERTELADELDISPQHVRNRLWRVVIGSFVVVLVGSFITLAITLGYGITHGKEGKESLETAMPLVQIMLTIFTTAVGFLTGLFAPSPFTPDGNRNSQVPGPPQSAKPTSNSQ